ncbi:MAG TPA: hypothetical protein VGQ89_14110 [Candidatus Limnocylindrales bacterium]|nr:hypothetical protein [Candidatus Limnocylindrales bacterium]
MRAWWSYWLTFGLAAVLWIGAAIAAPAGGMRAILAQPLWMILLLAPLVVAGLILIVFRESHETICRLEVARHPWLRYLVGGGYSALTFAITGFALLVLVALVIAGRLGGAM